MKIFVVLVFVAVASQVQGQSIASFKEKLLADKKGYNQYVNPDDLEVEVGMTYVCAQYDEKTHKLISRVFERYMWVDSRLAWKPDAYGGVDKLAFPANKIWTPHLHLMDSISGEHDRDEVEAVILANGTVHWHAPATYETLCKPSPEEDHVAHCRIRLVQSFIYDSEASPIIMTTAAFDNVYQLMACPYMTANPEFTVTHVKYTCCPNPHYTFEISFDLKERPKDTDDRDEDEPITDQRLERLKRFGAKSKKCAWPYC